MLARFYLTLILSLLIATAASAMEAEECPLGLKQEPLNIHQVMINFGKTVGEADSVASQAVHERNVRVQDSELTRSIVNLGIAISCAQAVLDHPVGPMLPERADFLTGSERASYLTHFLDEMRQFRDILIDYRQIFQQLLALPESSRNFQALYQESQIVTDLVNGAHRHLATKSLAVAKIRILDEPATLKQNMKQIGQLMHTILMGENDPTQDALNAHVAEQVAQVLTYAKSQVPDSISSLESNAQAAAFADYQSLIEQEITLSHQLSSAFSGHQSSTVTSVVQQMLDLSKTGHERYKL